MNTIATDEIILEKLTEKFDKRYLKSRRVGNKNFIYIPEPLIRDRLNEVLGLNWEWEIREDKLLPYNQEAERMTKFTQERDPRENLQVVVRGALTIHLPSGKAVVREAFGGSPLLNGSMAGDAHKSASSNAFKKAAYMFNVGAYLGLDNLDAIDDTTSMRNSINPVKNNNYTPIKPVRSGQPNQQPHQETQIGTKRKPRIPGFTG